MITFVIVLLIGLDDRFVAEVHDQITEVEFPTMFVCEEYALNYSVDVNPLADINPAASHNFVGVCTEWKDGVVVKTSATPLS